jgi:hypothetical protein
MPPEYLTVQEAKRMQEALATEFKEFRTEIRDDIKDVRDSHDKLKGEVGQLKTDSALMTQGINDIKMMLKDKGQQRMTMVVFILGELVTIGVALFAKGS